VPAAKAAPVAQEAARSPSDSRDAEETPARAGVLLLWLWIRLLG
jgi:hypothetical protein